jgi:hypothetical protein
LGVVWRFLNVREYGSNDDDPKQKEDQLALRYDDYFNAKVEAATLSLLPNPFNKGDAWEVRLLAVNFIVLTANVRNHWKLTYTNRILARGYCIDLGR